MNIELPAMPAVVVWVCDGPLAIVILTPDLTAITVAESESVVIATGQAGGRAGPIGWRDMKELIRARRPIVGAIKPCADVNLRTATGINAGHAEFSPIVTGEDPVVFLFC